MLNRTVVSLLPLVPRPLVWRISRRYIAGTRLEEALEVVERLNRAGMSATLDVLGEDSTTREESEAGRDLYFKVLEGIQERRLDANISVKLSQLALRFDPDLCRTLTSELLAEAVARDNFVRLDMEDSSVTSATLDIYRNLRRQSPSVGAVIQSYMRRSRADVESLLAEGPTHLRLCKGIYVEPPDIAFQDRQEVRDSFVSLLALLLEGGAVKVGIATHDTWLVDAAIDLLQKYEVPKERYEFQTLLGVAERMRGELVANGHPLRVYVPFGEAWYAYSRRRLRENPQIAGHVVKQLLGLSG